MIKSRALLAVCGTISMTFVLAFTAGVVAHSSAKATSEKTVAWLPIPPDGGGGGAQVAWLPIPPDGGGGGAQVAWLPIPPDGGGGGAQIAWLPIPPDGGGGGAQI